MNPEIIHESLLDELGDSPLGRAVAASKIVDYGDRTLTVLAPNKRTAYMLEGKTLVDLLKRILIVLELEIVIQVEAVDGAEADPATSAWDHALEILRGEMPRGSFDTWVAEAQAVSLENGILTIAARNTYNRDWMENRIQETSSRLVSEFLGAPTQVNFIVEARKALPKEAKEKEQGDEIAAPEAPEKRYEIEAVYDTAYKAEVNPEKIVAFPGYALRLLQHGDLSAKEMSLWVAFRQAVYHSSTAGKGTVRNIPYQEIVRFAMMSQPSYYREIAGKDSIAGGLVEDVPSEWHPGKADRHMDSARRWRVHMSPRLTRKDCNAIHAVLYRASSDAVSIPEAMSAMTEAMKEMAAASGHDYLDDPKNQERPLSGWPKNVIEIIRRILAAHGESLFRGDLPQDLHKAAENLQDHILRSFGTVMVSHYFLRQAAPKLGLSHGQAWTIIALRDRCWYDHVQKIAYSFAVLPGGMQELASLTGSTEKSVRNWLKDPAFRSFVSVEDTEGAEFPESWGWNPMVLDIRQTEPTADECQAILAQNSDVSDDSGKKRSTVREKVIDDQGKSDRRLGKKRSTVREKVIDDKGKSDRSLNNFIKPQLNPNKPQESPQTPRQNSAQKPGQVGSRAFWDWDALMSQNSVSMPMSKKLLIANKAAGRDISHLCKKFVSWVLYGYSEAGRGLSNPVSNALARLKENTYTGAGGDFDRLAELAPNTLRAFIDLDLAGRDLPENQHANVYAFNFARLPEPDKRELRQRLFGS